MKYGVRSESDRAARDMAAVQSGNMKMRNLHARKYYALKIENVSGIERRCEIARKSKYRRNANEIMS